MALAAASVIASTPAALADEYYLPRLVYPGTYGNFCGPTPEFPRGWHGNQPVDAVDRACQAHDAAYALPPSETERACAALDRPVFVAAYTTCS